MKRLSAGTFLIIVLVAAVLLCPKQLGILQNTEAETVSSQNLGWQIESTFQATKGSSFDRTPCLIQDHNGRLILIYSAYSGDYNLYSCTSDDGATWSNPLAISAGGLRPSRIQDRNGIYWLTYYVDGSGIWITKSNDAQTWQQPTLITSGSSNDWCRSPSLMQDNNGRYWIAYESSINRADVMVMGSNDGIHWSSPVRVTSGLYCEIRPCLIQDSSGVYYVIWFRLNGNDSCIWISNSTNGIDWSPSRQISTGMYSYAPRLIQNDNGDYVLTWIDSDVSHQGQVWITTSHDCANWNTPQKIVRGIDFSNLNKGKDGVTYVSFSADLAGNDDIWVMTLIQGTASSAWPEIPQGTFTARYTSIDDIKSDELQVSWKIRNINGWSGHQVDLRLWSCSNFTTGQENDWDLIAGWNVFATASGGSYSGGESIEGGIEQPTTYASTVETHSVDGTQNYWVCTAKVSLENYLQPNSVIQFATEVDQAPVEYSGDLPYYGQSGDGDYCRVIYAGENSSTSSPTTTPIPTSSPNSIPTSTPKPVPSGTPIASPTPTVSPLPTTTPSTTAIATPTPKPNATETVFPSPIPKQMPIPTSQPTISPTESTHVTLRSQALPNESFLLPIIAVAAIMSLVIGTRLFTYLTKTNN